MNDFRKIFRYFRPYKFSLFVGIFCIFASSSFSLSVPNLVGLAIDYVSENYQNNSLSWQNISYYPILILLANGISGILLFWQRRLIINMSRDIEYDMRQEFYSHIIHQPLLFFQKNRVGDLMARATNDMSAVRQIVGPMILYTFQAIFAVGIALPVLLKISWFLTLMLFLTMPLVSLTIKILGQIIHVQFEKIQAFFSDITARTQENLSGVRVVRAYAQERSEIAEFQQLNRVYANKNLELVKYSAAMRPLMMFFIGLGFVLIVAFGVPMVIRGEITKGEFVSFNLYLQRLIFPLIALGYVVNLWQRGTASLKRLDEIYSTEPEIKDAENVATQPDIKGKIEFRHLDFSYNEDSPKVLQDINLTIEQGQTAAFVGKTGSGKSTLISLVPRLLDVPENSVFIDEIPIKNFPLEQLRKSIGFVQQETFLFSESLAENIAFGVENEELKTESKIIEVAKSADLHDDIEGFQYKYEQILGERGITLSGGQKQRTAIARAILRNPRILILDDSLSAVDTYTEEKILNNLKSVRENRTTLIVSHRVSTVKDADIICVLANGKIIERGKHDELIKLNGEYAELYRLQLLEEELAATD
jgi:ATP-binding cassette subfamily B protein